MCYTRVRVIHRKIRYFTYKLTLLLFLSRDEGKHYILLPVSKIGIFRDHVAPPDFAENTDMAKDLDYKMGLDFWGLFFCVCVCVWGGGGSPSYRRINTVP